jgi:thioredoxin-dependent peroxiredoxin
MKHTNALAILALLITPMSLFADNTLNTGDVAPRLTVTTHTGETLDLGALYDKGPVLVYFYPKADTPGCTKQACNLRDNFDELQTAGVEVVGVSSDSVKSQQAFQEKYSLPFALVADEDRALGKAFGVGSFMGMAYKRQSFLVVDGKIAWRDLSAKPGSQSSDALQALAAAQ